jgi:hypothetical protein
MADDIGVNVNLTADASGYVAGADKATKATQALAMSMSLLEQTNKRAAAELPKFIGFINDLNNQGAVSAAQLSRVQNSMDNYGNSIIGAKKHLLDLQSVQSSAYGKSVTMAEQAAKRDWQIRADNQNLQFELLANQARRNSAAKAAEAAETAKAAKREWQIQADNQKLIFELMANKARAASEYHKQALARAEKEAAAQSKAAGASAHANQAKTNGLLSVFNTGLTGSIAKMGLYGAAAVKAFEMVKGTFGKIMHSYQKMGYDIYGLKLITNDTTEQVSELLYISQKFGVSSLSLQMRWAQAAKHLVDNNKWIRALGIEYKNLDGTTKPVINMLGEMGDKLNAMADSEKREAAAMAIFGRGYKDILPILVQGSAGMEKLREEARRYGVVWDDDDLRKSREYGMNMKELAAAFQGLTNIIAQKVAPILSDVIRKLALLIGSFTRSWKASAGFRTGVKLVALALVMLISPATAVIGILVYLIQHFEVVGDVIVAVSELLGTVVGKGVGVAAAAFKMLMDTVLEFAKGFLSVGEILTGNRFWKAVFGDGANEGIKAARDTIDGFKITMDKAVGGFAQSAWDNGGKWGKKFGEGAVSFIKKLKLPKTKMSDFNLGWLGGTEDPDPNAKGGGGGSKNKLLEHFKQMVEASRASLNALIEEAKNAKKQMDDTASSVRDALRGAFSIMELADETAGGRCGQGMLRLFQRRLEAMRGFVANLRRLRDMGVPADWLGEIAHAGVEKGAQVAQMLVNQPGVMAQMAELRTQMNVETQAAGEFVGQAMFGDKIADAISRSGAYQQQFQTLLLQGKKFGYQPTQEDIAVATQNIANSVYMTVGTNADPYAIEQAIAWALRTGMSSGGGVRRPMFAPSAGSQMSTNAPFFGGTLGPSQNLLQPGLQGAVD